MPPRKKAAPKNQCKFHCCALTDEVKASIRESTEEGRGRSMFEDAEPAPMCRCGVPRKPPGVMRYVDDDGLCVVHPDKPPQPWTRGAESHEAPDDDAGAAG